MKAQLAAGGSVMAGLVVVGLLAGGLLAVGGVKSPSAAPPRSTSSTATFLATVRQAGAGTMVDDQTDSDLITMGKGECADIAAGQTTSAYWSHIASAYSARDAESAGVSSYAQWMSLYGVWRQSSITAFCPQHL